MRGAPVPATRSTSIVSAHRSHTGHVRTSNEDVALDDPPHGLYGVFDGMGGMAAGEVAAQIAAASVLDAIRAAPRSRSTPGDDADLVHGSLVRASAAVFAAAQRVPAWRGMGTTAVVCLVRDPRRAYISHAGDSRAYLARAGAIYALTRDHTMAQEMVDRGKVDAREAPRHPLRNTLTRNLGAQSGAHPVDVTIGLVPGDRILLCSDGLTGYAQESEIARVLVAVPRPGPAADALVQLALAGGGGDNVTVIVVERTT